MALDFAHGAIQWLSTDAVSTTYDVSGLSFQPKAIRFYWMGHQSATDAVTQTVSERRGIGFASSTSSRRAVGTFSLNNAAAADTDGVAVNDCIAVTTTGAGAIDGKLDLNAINSDGFQLIVDDQVPASITVFWEAWGGSDITDVTIGDIAEPAATGTQNYTATGFTATDDFSQVVMFAGVQSTAAVGTAQISDSGLYVGFSTGTTTAQNIIVVGNSDEGSATLGTDGYNYTGDCVAMLTVAGGNPSARATLSAFDTDLFTLNWTNRATTNRRSIYMAIKGGSWQSGALTINGTVLNSTASVSSLPFNMKGLSFMGAMKAISTAGTSTTQDRISLGSASGTDSRRAMGIWDENSTANTEINHILEYDQILAFTTNAAAPTALKDLSAYSNTTYDSSFTVIVDSTGGNASEWVGYLVSGDNVTDISIDLTITQEDDTLTGAAEEPSTEIFATLDIAEADDSVGSVTSSMSITLLHDQTFSASSGTTSSFTVPDNCLLVVATTTGYSATPGLPSISDSVGSTYTTRISGDSTGGTDAYYNHSYRVATTPITTGGSRTVTVSEASASNIVVHVFAITGADTSSVIRQTKTVRMPVGADGAQSLTLDSSPLTNTLVLAFRSTILDTAVAMRADPGSGFTELGDNAVNYTAQQSQYRIDSTSTTVAWSDVSITGIRQWHDSGIIYALEFNNGVTNGKHVDVELFGNLAATEADDTLSSNGTVTSSGASATLTANEDSDTVTGEVDAEVAASGSFTEDGDTTTSAIDVELFGNLTVNETSDTSTAAVSVTTFASGNITEDADVFVAETNDAIAYAAFDEDADTVTSDVDLPLDAELNAINEIGDATTTSVKIGTLAAFSATEEADTVVIETNDALAYIAADEAPDSLTGASDIESHATLTVNEASDLLDGATFDGLASITATEADDTGSAAATVAVSVVLDNTELDDWTDTDADVYVSVTSTLTEADDTLDASTGVEGSLAASLNVTEENDSLTTVVDITTISVGVFNEENDTATGSGTVSLSGSGTITEADDTITGETLDQLATLSVTEEDDTTTTLVDIRINGTITSSEDGDTVTSATDVEVDTSLSSTEASDTLTAATLDQLATLSVTEGSDTSSSTVVAAINAYASVTSEDTVTGVIDINTNATTNSTEESDTLTASTSAQDIIGIDFTATEANDTATTVVDIGINGSITSTVASDTGTATATASISVVVISTDASDSLTSSTEIDLYAVAAIAEADDTSESAGSVTVIGSYTATDSDDSAELVTSVGVHGSLDYNEDGDTFSGTIIAAVSIATLTVTEESDTSQSMVGKIIKRVRINSVRAPRRLLQ